MLPGAPSVFAGAAGFQATSPLLLIWRGGASFADGAAGSALAVLAQSGSWHGWGAETAGCLRGYGAAPATPSESKRTRPMMKTHAAPATAGSIFPAPPASPRG